jgi:quercetin dioxygenase-like cupin family protein
MEFLTEADFKELSNPGVVSLQLLSPHNSRSTRITITRVTVQPETVQPRHAHEKSEQTWIAFSGTGTLLLADEERRSFRVGDVVRFEDGDVHGLENSGAEPFVYFAVTSPPIAFGYAYQQED